MRVFLILVLALSLVLVGCGEYSTAMDKGRQALTNNDYETAVAAFEQATNLKPSSEEAKTAYTDAVQKKQKANQEKEMKAKEQTLRDYLKVAAPLLHRLEVLGAEWDDIRQRGQSGQLSQAFGVELQGHVVKMRQLADDLSKVSVDPKMRQVHEIIIDTTSKNLQALTETLAALTQGDYSKITSANAHFAEASKSGRDYHQVMDDLAREVGLEINALVNQYAGGSQPTSTTTKPTTSSNTLPATQRLTTEELTARFQRDQAFPLGTSMWQQENGPDGRRWIIDRPRQYYYMLVGDPNVQSAFIVVQLTHGDDNKNLETIMRLASFMDVIDPSESHLEKAPDFITRAQQNPGKPVTWEAQVITWKLSFDNSQGMLALLATLK